MLHKNDKGLYECAICHGTHHTVRSLSVHIGKGHGCAARDYYDLYCREDGEGVCPVCGKPTRFRSLADGYFVYCSRKCATNATFSDEDRKSEIVARRELTCMERYGVPNGGGTASALEKARETNRSRRGVDWAMQDPSVVGKSKSTCLAKYDATTYRHSEAGEVAAGDTTEARYGRRNFFSGAEGRDAARAGYLEKHGVDHNMHDPEFLAGWKTRQLEENGGVYFVQTGRFREMSRATQEAKYGTWYSASDEGRRAYRATMLAKHGVCEYFQSEDFRNKSEATNMARRGVANPSQCPEVRQRRESTCELRYGARHYSQSEDGIRRRLAPYLDRLAEFSCSCIAATGDRRIRYACSTCGSESDELFQFVRYRLAMGVTPCTCCMPKNPPTSLEENGLADYVRGLGFRVDHYDRDFLGPYGADIVVEERKLIVEYDGLFWHSELFRDNGYHLRKTLLARDKGYRLVHVFSDEWETRRPVVKSRLRHLLGVDRGERIHARKCEVMPVDSRTATEFADRNHLQGAVNAKWRYGLYSGDRLVSLMTFGSSRFGDGIEMLRFCSDMDCSVPGAAGKLFRRFVAEHQEVSEVVSYADARWSDGGAFYGQLGFSEDAVSAPGYFIVEDGVRRNRLRYQRHLIAGPDDAGKSEHDITMERGLYRIYDCGQYRFVWRRR